MIYPGYIINLLGKLAKDAASGICLENHQANGCYGVHQVRVRVKGDPTTYRLILAPEDAPIEVNGRPISAHFAEPLGGV